MADIDEATTGPLFVSRAPMALLATLREIREQSGIPLNVLVIATMCKAVGMDYPDRLRVDAAMRRYRRER